MTVVSASHLSALGTAPDPEDVVRSGQAAHRHPPRPTPDLDAATAAAGRFLTALGMDVTGVGVAETPRRMAAAFAEMLTPRPFQLTTFPNDHRYDGLVLARDLPVQSLCEHHLLPFVGVAHVGYLPGERIVGLSKLPRVVEMFARRPQVQERLTQQVAAFLQERLDARGVGVVIQAEHFCMALRGVRTPAATTVTTSLLGRLEHDDRSRAEFLHLAGAGSSHTLATAGSRHDAEAPRAFALSYGTEEDVVDYGR